MIVVACVLVNLCAILTSIIKFHIKWQLPLALKPVKEVTYMFKDQNLLAILTQSLSTNGELPRTLSFRHSKEEGHAHEIQVVQEVHLD